MRDPGNWIAGIFLATAVLIVVAVPIMLTWNMALHK